MLAYTTKKSLFPSAGCSPELIENPTNQEEAGAEYYLFAAADGLALKPKSCSPPVRSCPLLPST